MNKVKIKIKILITLLVFAIFLILFLWYRFVGHDCFFKRECCGYDDGPFHGTRIEINTDNLILSDSLKTSFGMLYLINREYDETPIMMMKKDNIIIWIDELNIAENKDYKNKFLHEITNLELVSEKLIFFYGEWDFGNERGRLFLTSEGEIDYFCLSW